MDLCSVRVLVVHGKLDKDDVRRMRQYLRTQPERSQVGARTADTGIDGSDLCTRIPSLQPGGGLLAVTISRLRDASTQPGDSHRLARIQLLKEMR